jgi:hypothetical protein
MINAHSNPRASIHQVIGALLEQGYYRPHIAAGVLQLVVSCISSRFPRLSITNLISGQAVFF